MRAKVFHFPIALRRSTVPNTRKTVITRRMIIWRGGLDFSLQFELAVADPARNSPEEWCMATDKRNRALEYHHFMVDLLTESNR